MSDSEQNQQLYRDLEGGESVEDEAEKSPHQAE